MLFKKGSQEAKDYMARLRACKVSGTQTKLAFKKAKPKKKSEFPIKPTTPKKRVVKQTGTSDTYLDKLKKALPPGKRTSSSGVEYYEYRKNRTDAKGKLTGIGDIHTDILNKNIIQDYEYSKKQISIFEIVLNNHILSIKNPENRVYKAQLTRQKKQIENYLKEMKQHVKEIKKLL